MTIREICQQVRTENALENLPAIPVLALAPFGQEYVDSAARLLNKMRAWRKLAQQGDCQVLLFTGRAGNTRQIPDWVKVVRISSVPEWPEPDRFQNRFCKWALPFLLPQVSLSIYVDSQNIMTVDSRANIRRLFKLISREGFVLTKHARRDWQAELAAIQARPESHVFPGRLLAQQRHYETTNLPLSMPIYIASLIGRRHEPKWDELNTLVLEQIQQFSERDQVALPYAVFKTNIQPFVVPDGYLLSTYYGKESVSPRTICFVHTLTSWKRLGWTTKARLMFTYKEHHPAFFNTLKNHIIAE